MKNVFVPHRQVLENLGGDDRPIPRLTDYQWWSGYGIILSLNSWSVD
jgi:hypothetical protein